MHDHFGHRSRLKERFLAEGLDNFQEHEILELLLFYAIPQGNTNPLAHSLIRHFGSLRGVFMADPAALLNISGIGTHSMVLLKLIPAIFKRFSISGQKLPRLINTKAAAAYIVPQLENSREEEFHIFCLDISYRPIYHELMFKGTLDSLVIQLSRVVKTVVRQDTARLVIAHTHPAGEPNPSIQDITLTKKLVHALDAVSVPLTDHIIVAPGAYYSFAAGSAVSTLRQDESLPAAQYVSIAKKSNTDNQP